MKKDVIDFVVLWVNPNDKNWQITRKKYSEATNKTESIDDREERYRDWDLFRYWFRGVEQFAPWVNKIHLVTYDHVPEWLNINHPKINIVKHSDIIPEDALPTFNSNAIELCVHKIPGLAEHFVLFNDDVFITKKVKPTDFFKNGKPVNTMALFSLMPSINGQLFYKVVANNLVLINKNFNFQDFKKKNIGKCLSLKQREWLLFTIPALFYNQFIGFRNFHLSNSYLKSTFDTVWKKETTKLKETVYSRFRNNETDVSHWVMNYWQFASGNFIQRNAHFGISVFVNNKKIQKLISKQRYKILCINDATLNSDLEYERTKKNIVSSFESILPIHGGYEK